MRAKVCLVGLSSRLVELDCKHGNESGLHKTKCETSRTCEQINNSQNPDPACFPRLLN